LINIFPLKQ